MIDTIVCGNNLKLIEQVPNRSVDCIITSPPYYKKRQYNTPDEIGWEATVSDYLDKLVLLAHHCKRILKPHGTFWLNIDDTYSSSGSGRHRGTGKKQLTNEGSLVEGHQEPGISRKNLLLIPQRLTIRLQEEVKLTIRSVIVWAKPNPVTESVRDRPTHSYEPIIFATRSAQYHYDYQAVMERALYDGRNKDTQDAGGKYDRQEHKRWQYDPWGAPMRNKRDVWTIPSQSSNIPHYAMFPEDLIVPMIKAGCPPGGIVFDPFMGSGTVAVVAKRLGCHFYGIEGNPAYVEIAQQRIREAAPDMLPLFTEGTSYVQKPMFD